MAAGMVMGAGEGRRWGTEVTAALAGDGIVPVTECAVWNEGAREGAGLGPREDTGVRECE